jgi:flagellar hook protein FlgE
MTTGLFASVSGVRANQTRINVVSNNVANVNTIGFKSSLVNFATVFSNTISGGGAPTGTVGGTNPKQIGTGVLISEIAQSFNQGGTQFTGKNTDMMINGNGFFAVERPDVTQGSGAVSSSYYLTRGGNFTLDSDGNMVTSNGFRVRGTSQISGSGPSTLSYIRLPQQMLVVKDLNTNSQIVRTHFALPGTANATLAAAIAPGAATQTVTAVKLVTFSVGADGAMTATYSNGDRITVRSNPLTVSAADPTLTRREMVHLPAEGGTYPADVDGDGVPSTVTDNGVTGQINSVFGAPPGGNPMEGMQLQLQVATVVNPNGLLAESDNNFSVGPNSGLTTFGTPGSENRGTLQGGALESSNVDLAAEFTNLIVAQRGLEANSKLIRAQSEVLQSVINII